MRFRLPAWGAGFPRDLIRPGAFSAADQVMLSGTAFFVGFVLARFTSPQNYGAWALVVGVQLVLAGVQAAVVTTPLTLLGAPRAGEGLRRWVSALLLGQTALSAALAAALAAAALLTRALAADPLVARALAAASAALVFVQVQEFCRRVLFLRLAAARVLLNDAVYCALQVAGVATLLALDRRAGTEGVWLDASHVLATTAAAALAATALGLLQTRELLGREGVREAAALWREAWEMGRFNLGAQAGTAVLQYANRFIAMAIGGTPGVALIEAPRLLVAPLAAASISLGNVSSPKAAIAHAAGGKQGLLRFLVPLAVLWATAYVAYALVVGAAPGFWLRLLYRGKFAGAETVLLLWCVSYAVAGLQLLPSAALRVTRHYDAVMWSSLLSGAVMVAASIGLGRRFGIEGVLAGRLVGETVLLGLFAWAFARHVLPGRRQGGDAAG